MSLDTRRIRDGLSSERQADANIRTVERPERLLRLPEVIERVGLKRSAIYQRMAEGRFPVSRSLGSRCAVWLESEIDAWIAGIAIR